MSFGRIICWVLVGLGVLTGLAAIVLSVRASQTEAELGRAIQLSAADHAYLRELPEMDDALRDEVHAWMKTSWPAPLGQPLAHHAWFLEGEEPPAEHLDRHEKARAHVAKLTDLMDRGVTCVTSAVWLRDAFESRKPFDRIHIPNLLNVRGAADWYVGEAMLSDDPGPWLRNLDRLMAALRPAGGLIDAMIANAVAGIRDGAYVRLAYRGVLPASTVGAWLQETPGIRRNTMHSIHAERLLWCRIGQLLIEDDPAAETTLYGGHTDLDERLDRSWNANRDLARLVDSLRLYEGYLDGRVLPNDLDRIAEWKDEGGRLIELGMMNYDYVTALVLDLRTQHRIKRVLVRIMQMPGTYPASLTELRERLGDDASLLDGGSWDLPLDYERIAEDRVRVFIPTDAPVPARVPQDYFTHAHRRQRGEWMDGHALYLGQASSGVEMQRPR